MANEVEDKMELAFLEILRGYENQWVAIHEGPDMEVVVGSGRTAVEAKRIAEGKGFNEAALFKVLPLDKGYIPIADPSDGLRPQIAHDSAQR